MGKGKGGKGGTGNDDTMHVAFFTFVDLIERSPLNLVYREYQKQEFTNASCLLQPTYFP